MGTEFVVLGTENQMNIHYTMPIRGMLYDALSYTSQTEEIKQKHRKCKDLKSNEYLTGFSRTDKLLPVITLIIYYGKNKWDGCKDLHEMIAFPTIGESLREYVNNYKMNLLWAYDVTNLEKYQSGLRELFGVLKNEQDGKGLREHINANRERFSNLDDETYSVISSLTNMEQFEIKKEEYRNEKGGLNMCKAMIEIKEEGMREGMREGEQIGEKRTLQLMQLLKKEGRTEDLMRSIEDESYRNYLYKEYHLDN